VVSVSVLEGGHDNLCLQPQGFLAARKTKRAGEGRRVRDRMTLTQYPVPPPADPSGVRRLAAWRGSGSPPQGDERGIAGEAPATRRAAGLSSAEVLSVLLRGSNERSALEVAMDLLVACGDLGGLAGEAPPEVNRLPEGDDRVQPVRRACGLGGAGRVREDL